MTTGPERTVPRKRRGVKRGRPGRGEIPRPEQRDWRALIYVAEPWDRYIRWILRCLDERRGLYVTRMARELGIRKSLAGALLAPDSLWVAWARVNLGLPASSGTVLRGAKLRAASALSELTGGKAEPFGNRAVSDGKGRLR